MTLKGVRVPLPSVAPINDSKNPVPGYVLGVKENKGRGEEKQEEKEREMGEERREEESERRERHEERATERGRMEGMEVGGWRDGGERMEGMEVGGWRGWRWEGGE
jgi:hypothetical protein